jgi:tryptophan-rich sensory protein
MLSNIVSLVLFLITITGFSKISWMLSRGCMPSWDKNLIAPFFLPPKWLFMFVWPALYILLGIAVWLVWQQRERLNINNAMMVFAIHMALNFAWSPVAFCTKSVTLGLVMLIAIMLLAYLNYCAFKIIDPVAGQLMIPYLLWLFFALILSLSYFVLNYPHPMLNGLVCVLARS